MWMYIGLWLIWIDIFVLMFDLVLFSKMLNLNKAALGKFFLNIWL